MTFSLATDVVRGVIEDHSHDRRVVAIVAGWAKSKTEAGPAGIGAVISRSEYDRSKQEVEWSIRLGTATADKAQKAAETFFWALIRDSLNMRFPQHAIPLTWICEGENEWMRRARILAKRAALVDGSVVWRRVR